MRSYVRIALCYSSQGKDVKTIETRLMNFFVAKIHQRPFLAGNVIQDQTSKQTGKLKIRFTRSDVDDWKPYFNHLSEADIPTYQDLDERGMPPSTFVGHKLNPLPDSPDEDAAAAFAVQATFIAGGVIVVIYMHHSVGDAHGFGLLMSAAAEAKTYMGDTLGTNAAAETLSRQNLSQANGVKSQPRLHPEWATLCAHLSNLYIIDGSALTLTEHNKEASGHRISANEHEKPTKSTWSKWRSSIFSFSHKRLIQLKKDLGRKLEPGNSDHPPFLSTFDCIAALFWMSVSRARFSQNNAVATFTGLSTLATAVDIRRKVKPAVPDNYIGNAVTLKTVSMAISRLLQPPSSSSCACYVASALRKAILEVDDHYTRSAISIINSCDDVRRTNLTDLDLGKDLVVTSLAGLPVITSDLGMGLGPPRWVRKPSTKPQGPGVIVLPSCVGSEVTEVMLQLESGEMDRLLADETFMDFVDRQVE